MLGARCDYQAPRKEGSRLVSTRKDPGRRIQSRRTNNSGLGGQVRRGWAVVPCNPRNRTRGTCPAHNSPSTTEILGHEPEAQAEVHLPLSNYARSVIASGTVGPSGGRPPPGSSGARTVNLMMKKEYQRLGRILVVPPSGKTATSQGLVRLIWLMACIGQSDESVARIFYGVLLALVPGCHTISRQIIIVHQVMLV